MSYCNYCITPSQANGLSYRTAMRDEIATWGRMDLEALSKTAINHPLLLAYKARILGGRATTSNYSDWTEFLLHEFGPRKSCFSLGAGMGRVEEYLMQIGFCSGFNAVELAGAAVASARNRAPELNASTGDLNFIELVPNTYDFILCHGVMHHLINIEHVLEQINQALTEDGVFVLYEYIGANRWQFADSTLSRLRRECPGEVLVVPELWQVGGFESIRSEDIRPIFNQTFESRIVKQVLYGGAYFPYITCSKSPSDSSIQRVVALDETAAIGGELSPCYMMAIARKTENKPPRALPWSDKTAKERLVPPMPIVERMARAVRRTRIAPVLRQIKKMIT